MTFYSIRFFFYAVIKDRYDIFHRFPPWYFSNVIQHVSKVLSVAHTATDCFFPFRHYETKSVTVTMTLVCFPPSFLLALPIFLFIFLLCRIFGRTKIVFWPHCGQMPATFHWVAMFQQVQLDLSETCRETCQKHLGFKTVFWSLVVQLLKGPYPEIFN